MFSNPSLTTRIAIGKAIGFLIGLAGFVLLPWFMPEAGWLIRWGILALVHYAGSDHWDVRCVHLAPRLEVAYALVGSRPVYWSLDEFRPDIFRL